MRRRSPPRSGRRSAADQLSATKPDLARDLVDAVAERFADHDIHMVADAAYGCGAFIGLGDGMTMTTRARGPRCLSWSWWTVRYQLIQTSPISDGGSGFRCTVGSDSAAGRKDNDRWHRWLCRCWYLRSLSGLSRAVGRRTSHTAARQARRAGRPSATGGRTRPPARRLNSHAARRRHASRSRTGTGPTSWLARCTDYGRGRALGRHAAAAPAAIARQRAVRGVDHHRGRARPRHRARSRIWAATVTITSRVSRTPWAPVRLHEPGH